MINKHIDSLERCIQKSVIFKIIFIEKPNVSSKAYQILLEAKKGGKNINFKSASQEFISQLSRGDDKLKHFAVFDDDKFRFETDPKNFVAYFSFNDKNIAASLSNVFDKGFQN